MELRPECAPSELEGWKEACEWAQWKGGILQVPCPKCNGDYRTGGVWLEAEVVPPSRKGEETWKFGCGCGFEGLTDVEGRALWYPQ